MARLTFFGLYALQHRGQESAGITTSDGRAAYMHKDMGLVSQVFNEDNLRPLKGHLAIGHNRYSTTGSSHFRNVQPYLIETIYGPLGVAHNGNLTNALELRHKLLTRGVGLSSTTDSEVITQILASPPEVWTDEDHYMNGYHRRRVGTAHSRLYTGGGRRVFAGDPDARCGLCRARSARAAPAVPRRTGERLRRRLRVERALDHWRDAIVREVKPGEIVRLDSDGMTSIEGHEPLQPALCSFEYVYFARPDSVLEGQTVHNVRQRMGRELAREVPGGRRRGRARSRLGDARGDRLTASKAGCHSPKG